jgi:hypothetical protein
MSRTRRHISETVHANARECGLLGSPWKRASATAAARARAYDAERSGQRPTARCGNEQLQGAFLNFHFNVHVGAPPTVITPRFC